MAILSSDGNYIKLDLTNTYIDSKGVHIASQVYLDKSQRQVEKELHNKFLDYSNNVKKAMNQLILSKDEEKISMLASDYNLSKQVLSVDISDKDKYFAEFKNLKLIKELGFDEAWLDIKFQSPIGVNVISGPYLKQDFTHKSMYNELKKTLKGQKYEDV